MSIEQFWLQTETQKILSALPRARENNLSSKTDIHTMLGFRPFSISEHADYRFGFNGQEKDDEVKGNGNSLDFGARIYDPRLGRWLSMDPLQAKYASLSPYNFTANNPILNIDYDGRDYGVYVNHDTKTIVISANIYTVHEDLDAAQAGAVFWNDQSGKFVYETIGDNGEKLEYDIYFEVMVVAVEATNQDVSEMQPRQGATDPNEIVAVSEATRDPIGNSLIEREGTVTGDDRGMTVSGKYMYVDPNKKDNATERHEVGHGLGQPNHIGTYKNVQASGETRYPNAEDVSTVNIGRILENFNLGSEKQRKQTSKGEMESKQYSGGVRDLGSDGVAPKNFKDGTVQQK